MRIFLVGFMGSGKSFWGRQWAARHNYSFLDLDEAIEAQENQLIASIFQKKGEGYFRTKEAEVLRTTLQMDNCIIACGGGTACFNANMEWMNANGITIYLEASPGYILGNIKDDINKRPLIAGIDESERLGFIEKTLQDRAVFYRQAKYSFPAEKLNIESIDEVLGF